MAASSVLSRDDKATKAFASLDSQCSLFNACVTEWKDLEQHCADLEKALQQKLAELSEREKEFNLKTAEAKAALDKRESSIASREQASLNRVQEQKDAAIAAISEEKKKVQKGVSSSPGNQEGKELKKRKKDAKVEEGDKEGHKESQKKTKTKGDSTVAGKEQAPSTAKGKPNNAMSLEEAISKVKAASEAEISSQLNSFCKNMDAEGLRKFVLLRQRDADGMRKSLPSTLKSASDPCRLILKAVEELHEAEVAGDSRSAPYVFACILLLECLTLAVADPVLGVDYPLVPSDIKELARLLARRWKSKLDVRKPSKAKLDVRKHDDQYVLYVHGFLQLIGSYGLAADYSDDELLTYVALIARRTRAPELSRSLGLSAKIPGLVSKLGKEGRQLEALTFAHSFGIMDKAQPDLLLKSYVEDAKKAAELLVKKASNKLAGQNDACMKEISALKNVQKTVEKYNLGAYYALENLQKRISQLEQEKQERKKGVAASKLQKKKGETRPVSPKKSYISEVRPHNYNKDGGAFQGTTYTTPLSSVSALGKTDVGQYGGSMLSSYGLLSQTGYERRADPVYGSLYGAGSQSPLPSMDSLTYPSRDSTGYLRGTASTYNVPGSYSSYQFGGASASARGYLSPYLR